jgi:septum site-determining protein MinC
MSATAPLPAFDVKSAACTLTALRLQVASAAALGQALDERFAETPGLFEQEPVVIDLSPLREADAALDWPAVLAPLRQHGMAPVGVHGGSAAQMQAARAAGLPELPLAARRAAPASTATPATAAPEPEPSPAPRQPALVVDKPLRSGQRVYARGGDLVILSVVSHGAEAIADGNIHVYGPLRGRAIAGARGDETARIFSTCLEPQLVSIAGVYRTTEQPLPPAVLGRPAQVRLEGEKIIVEPLAT